MKFTVDVKNFYLREDDDLKIGLTRYIISKITEEIWKRVQSKVEDSVNKAIKGRVENLLDKRIESETARLIQIGKIVNKDYNGKPTGEVTLEQFIKERFLANSGWSTPQGVISDIAKKFGQELKARYDVAFATQIVIKLNEQGMLKENVAKLLLQEQKA
jgi:hypothetical protein